MVVVSNGGQAPGCDMIGHADAVEWLRTLPWWDWRDWSDWFYGGQAIGVNYPPLGHALMQLHSPGPRTDGSRGPRTASAAAVGHPASGRVRLGFAPWTLRAAVAAVPMLAAASGQMHWVLSGFHQQSTFFGSWTAMLASVIGLFAAAWAALCHRPVAGGVVLGVAVLLNATVVPGVAVVYDGAAGHERRLVPPSRSLGSDGRGRRTKRCAPGEMVPFDGGLGQSGALGSPTLCCLEQRRHLAGRDAGDAGNSGRVGCPWRYVTLPAPGHCGSGRAAGNRLGRSVRLLALRALAGPAHTRSCPGSRRAGRRPWPGSWLASASASGTGSCSALPS